MIQSHRPRGQATGQLVVEIVRTAERLEQLHEEYDDLLDASANGLPFFTHFWHVSWCRHFLNQDPRIRDELFVHVLRTADGLCVAIVPLVRSRRRIGPFSLVSASLLGADPAFTEIRGAIVRPGFEQAAARKVIENITALRMCDWIHWSDVRGPFWEALRQKGPLQPGAAVPFYLLDLPPTWEELRRRLKRNIRESIRHCYNSLKRDGHEFEFEVISEAAGVAAALAQFLVLHRQRATARGTMVHADRFESARSRAFLQTVCEGFAMQGMLRIFQLRIRGQVVAMRVAFKVRDSLYLYYSGYDPAWSRYSVMTTTVVEAIKYAIAHGLKTVNLSPGADVSKTRWGGREVYSESGFQHDDRLQSRVARSAYQHAVSGHGLSSQLLKRLISAHRRWD